MVSFLIMIIAMVGILLNVNRKWQGFMCWLVSNGYWFVYNITIEEYLEAMDWAEEAGLTRLDARSLARKALYRRRR